MEKICSRELAGRTVKQMLSEMDISSKTVTALKKKPMGITVNGRCVTVRYVLCEGDILRLDITDTEPSGNIIPSPIPIEILYEDSSLTAVNKPSLMPTHPSHGHFDDTLANALCHYKGNDGKPFVFRPVNRLDRNTSGAVLVANNRVSAARLSSALQNGKIEKRYLAVLCGVPTEEAGQLETYIRRREESIIYREICDERPDADYALTRYRVLEISGGHALVMASPITGRTHQLRLHFAHIGCPILGDDLYGEPSSIITRQALHAYSLVLPHPETGEELSIVAPLPQDLKEALKKLGFQYN